MFAYINGSVYICTTDAQTKHKRKCKGAAKVLIINSINNIMAILIAVFLLILLLGVFVMSGILLSLSKPDSCYGCKFYDYGYCSLHRKQVEDPNKPCNDGEKPFEYGNPYKF